MNPNIQGPIPINGRGFVARDRGNFQPGEFKRCSNLEFNGTELKNRRNVYSVEGSEGSAVSGIDNSYKLIGSLGTYTIATAGEKQYMFNSQEYGEIWNTPSLGPAAAGSFSRVVGCFRYNGKNYWIVFEFDADIGNEAVNLSLYHADIPTSDVPSSYDAAYEATLTRTQIITVAGTAGKEFREFQFKNAFLHKDRLWIATSTAVYCSMATDPTVFVAPQGFFIKYPENTINWIMGVRDYIYVLAKDSVHRISYDSDPNVDGSSVVVSPGMGGEHGCVHKDTPFFINNVGIYSINDLSIDKVLDSRFDVGTDFYQNFIHSFEDYLIVNKANAVNYDKVTPAPSNLTSRANLFTHGVSNSDGVGTEILTDASITRSPNTDTDVDGTLDVQEFTNLVTNPSFETNTTGWTSSAFISGILRQNTTGVVAGSWAASWQITNYSSGGDNTLEALSPSCNVVAGKTYRVGLDVTYGQLITAPFLRIRWFSDSGLISTTSQAVNVYGHRSFTATAPVGAVTAQIIFACTLPAGTYSGTRTLWTLDAAYLYEDCNIVTYFDGDTVDTADLIYSWTGAAHASTSKIKASGPTVAVTAVADGSFSGKVLQGACTAGKWLPKNTHFFFDIFKTQTLVGSGFAANTEYTYQFKVKPTLVGTGSIESAHVILDILDGGVDAVATKVVDIENLTPDVWNTVNIPIVVPSTAATVRIIAEIKYPLNTLELEDVSYRFTDFLFERSSSFNNSGSSYFNGSYPDIANVIDYSWSGAAWESISTSLVNSHGYLKSLGYDFTPFRNNNSLGYNTYFINTETGFTSVFDFKDQNDNGNDIETGYVVNFLTNPQTDSSGNYYLYFLTNKLINDGATLTYKSHIYRLGSSEDISVSDLVANKLNVIARRAPKIDLEIDSFVPDGNEYLTKKFRALEFMGIFPKAGINFQKAFDNNSYTDAGTELADNFPNTGASGEPGTMEDERPHFPHRIGINQRAKALTLRFKNEEWWEPLGVGVVFGFFELSDVRTRWSYTKRANEHQAGELN